MPWPLDRKPTVWLPCSKTGAMSELLKFKYVEQVFGSVLRFDIKD